MSARADDLSTRPAAEDRHGPESPLPLDAPALAGPRREEDPAAVAVPPVGPAPLPHRGRVSLEWLDADDELAADREAEAGQAPERADDLPDRDPGVLRRRLTVIVSAMVVVILGAVGGYVYLRPAPEPTSAALKVEHEPDPAGTPIGAADPVPGAGPDDASPESSRAAEPDPAPVAGEGPAAEALQPVEPVPASPAAPPGPQPAPALPTAGTADGERLVQLVRQLETHQALIERLERAEKLLRDRVDGLEVATQARDESGQRRRSAAAPEAATADEAGTADEPATAEPRRHASAPKPVRAVRKTPRSLPPSTSSRPVKALPPREPSPEQRARLPFSVESVDTWNGEKTIVVRSRGRLIDLRPGDSHQGWRIESAQGQTVTVRTPDGHDHTIEAGSEP
jgi:hypothetical protein